uniref:MADF domain-containing protein n=1 Tax=Glossina morsitans morsitans TaxID=37546 RepID=A0A1B0GBI1_GLOMM
MTNRYYVDRENYGPEFDDRLIKLVRAHPAIYDIHHPHYRRNPVRIQIWSKIGKELGAPSRFLQTKWKNIRYNYLQELKSIETGQHNANIRKRRFTEDLSFLKQAALGYTPKREKSISGHKTNYSSSDADSNSHIFPDNYMAAHSNFEVIEIEHSDEEGEELSDSKPFLAPVNGSSNGADDAYEKPDQPEATKATEAKSNVKSVKTNPQAQIIIPTSSEEERKIKTTTSPSHSDASNRSSPLLTPIMNTYNSESELNEKESIRHVNGSERDVNGTTNNLTREVTIEPLAKRTRPNPTPPEEIMSNVAKRKAIQIPNLPALTPINDPIELYCLSLVDSLRAMPRSERERVKYEFAKILKDATYRDYS